MLNDELDTREQVQKRFAHIKQWHAPYFSLWKRTFAWPYLSPNEQKISWRTSNAINAQTTVVWGGTLINALPASSVVRMEDGFIHSLGLGSDLSPPCSQVLDATGIYFDAQHNNDLFILLNTYIFDVALLLRAEALRRLIVDAGITKYNLGRQSCAWKRPVNQRVILVVGQVADDASVKLGASGAVDTIDKMLALVWQNNPNAMIVYKPHPDVMSGNRNGLIEAQQFCHLVDSDADIVSLIEQVDEIHTLSSLAGFDALIRGKTVVTYGLPFYAGWGLTQDHVANIPHRSRLVSLDMLVAAALILYPIYWDWDAKAFTSPESIVAKLAPYVNRPIVSVGRYERLAIKGWRWCINVTKLVYLQIMQLIK
jgi:capsular polysaccharide export protein